MVGCVPLIHPEEKVPHWPDFLGDDGILDPIFSDILYQPAPFQSGATLYDLTLSLLMLK